MAEAGVPVSEVAQYLGHTNKRITESTSARYSPEYLKGAARALDVSAAWCYFKHKLGFNVLIEPILC